MKDAKSLDEDWCAWRVALEDSLVREGTPLDVWPAGWSEEMKEHARRVGRAHASQLLRDAFEEH